MDYEKKQRLIALCESMKEYGYLDGVEELKSIFPELAESEEEKIRKKLYHTVLGTPDTSEWFEDISKDAMLAWLEKQKDHFRESTKKVEPHFTKRNALFDECVANCDPEVMKRVSDEIDEMLQKEQKPSCGNVNVESEFDKGWRAGHKAGLKDAEQQKPAEWSEEDETAYGDLIWCIEQARKSAKDENDMGNIWFAENWVKKRIKSLRPSWKPSEEQMNVFDGFYHNYILDQKDYEVLKSLYDDLKRLMMEEGWMKDDYYGG